MKCVLLAVAIAVAGVVGACAAERGGVIEGTLEAGPKVIVHYGPMIAKERASSRGGQIARFAWNDFCVLEHVCDQATAYEVLIFYYSSSPSPSGEICGVDVYPLTAARFKQVAYYSCHTDGTVARDTQEIGPLR